MMRHYKVICVWISILLCTGCVSGQMAGEQTETTEIVIDESMLYSPAFSGEPFNEKRPCLCLNGEIYYWDRVVRTYQTSLGISFPEGYEVVGTITPVQELPTQSGEFWGPEFQGEIYVNPQIPEAVYLRACSDSISGWEEGQYVRMVTIALCHEGANQLYLHGKQFWPVNSYFIEESLPEGYEVTGTVKFIGVDLVPENDFETNAKYGLYGNALDGKEVYCNEAFPDTIYIPIKDIGGQIWYCGINADLNP